MKYCRRCLQPDTRPNIQFNEEQICYACLWEDKKKEIDWEKRKKELIEIAEEAKEKAQKKGLPYDCVIGVSGGKDSTFQSFYARDELGLRVLLVNSIPEGLTKAGRHNINNLVEHGSMS